MITCSICNLSCNGIKALSCHLTKQHKDITKQQYYNLYLKSNEKEGKCVICENDTKFRNIAEGYSKTCSNRCTQLQPEIKEKIKNTFLQNYGDHPLRIKEIKDKAKQTFVKNIGLEKQIKEKPIKTTINKNECILNNNSEENNKNRSFECIDCGIIFENHLNDERVFRCLNCYTKIAGTSMYENEIVDFIKSIKNDIEIILNDRTIIEPFDLDIYLPEYKVAIDFDGFFYHSESKGKNHSYHLNKTNLCKEKDITLLHIFEDEWVYKSHVIKSIILNKLGLIPNKIFARKCVIKEVTPAEAREFLENNHIQGNVCSSIKLALFYNDEMVSLLTFGKSRFNKNYEYEIHRFCSKLNTSVVGGFSKLFKYFVNKYSKSIITYADLRYGTGNVYLNNGFDLLHASKPNYYYFKLPSILRESRNKYQKHKLEKKLDYFNPGLSEIENMRINGYDRIWDCGNNVFVYKEGS